MKFIFITFIVYSISLFILRAEQKKSVTKYVDSASNWIARELLHVMFRLFIHSSFIPYSIFFCLWRVIIESFGGSKWKKKSNSFLLVLMEMGVLQHTVLYSLTFFILYRIYQFIGYVLNAIFKDYSLCSIYVYIHKNIRSKL